MAASGEQSIRRTGQSGEQADFRPTANWDRLRLRAAVMRTLRSLFDARGYLEVETPIAAREAVVDRHLDLFETRFAPNPRLPQQGTTLLLQTSPEAHMKRLLAAGGEAIYQFARVFRNGEQGPRHNPEFTLLEWYRPGDSPADQMQFLSDLCCEILGSPPAERVSYGDLFGVHVGVDPHRAAPGELRQAASKHNVAVPASLEEADRDGWLDLLLVTVIEPNLPRDRPLLVFDYPASQAALARCRDQDGVQVAERFELYVAGIELANGYHELLAADELRARSHQQNGARALDGKSPLPLPEKLLAALEFGLPACTGVALGVDRLVMLAAGVEQIDDVIAFGFDRA